MVPRLCDSFRSLVSGGSDAREPRSLYNAYLQLLPGSHGIEGSSFPELRIIADFQAGCPTGVLSSDLISTLCVNSARSASLR